MYRFEHIAYPFLWVENPSTTVSFKDYSGHGYTYGYFSLNPVDLETALLNRLADVLELEFLNYENWEETIPLEFSRKTEDCPDTVWKTDFAGFRDHIKQYLAKTSRLNRQIYHANSFSKKQNEKQSKEKSGCSDDTGTETSESYKECCVFS